MKEVESEISLVDFLKNPFTSCWNQQLEDNKGYEMSIEYLDYWSSVE